MQPKKTLIIGSKSYIGSHLLSAFQKLYPDTIGTHYHSTKIQIDLKNPHLKDLPIPYEEYSFAIIAAAQPKIPICEKNEQESFLCNLQGPLKLSEQLKEREIFPVFFSTDYVFDGKEGNYDENSPVNPINIYGKHKAELEKKVREICGEDFLMIRLSKVFGTKKGDGTLIDEMAGLFVNNKKVRAAYDQVFCPIHVNDVVSSVMHLIATGKKGLYHVCGTEVWPRYDMAEKILKELEGNSELLERISLDDLGLVRPKHTHMKNDKLLRELPFSLRTVSESIQSVTEKYRN